MVTRTRAMMMGALRQRRGPLVMHAESSPSSSDSAWRLESSGSDPSSCSAAQGSSDVSSRDDHARDITLCTSQPHDNHDEEKEEEENDNNNNNNWNTSIEDEVSLLQERDSSDDEDDDDDDDDEDSSINSNVLTGLDDRILYHFQQRGRILSQVTRGKSLSYHNMILAREVASQELTLRRQYQGENSQQPFATTTTNDASPPSRPWTLTSLYQHFCHAVLFEMHHSLEAAWIAMWYCVGHLSFFMILDLFRRVVMNQWEISPTVVHIFLIVGGLTTMRVNGYLWTWLRQDSYQRIMVKELDWHHHRGQILDHWDTRILAWFRQRKTLQDVVSMMGFYMLYLGMTHFYEQIWIVCEQWMWAGYHSWEKAHVANFQHSVVLSEGNEVDMTTTTIETCNDDTLLHLTHWSWMGRYLVQFWCRQFSNKDLWLVCILFDTVVVVMASLALAVFGKSLFEE